MVPDGRRVARAFRPPQRKFSKSAAVSCYPFALHTAVYACFVASSSHIFTMSNNNKRVKTGDDEDVWPARTRLVQQRMQELRDQLRRVQASNATLRAKIEEQLRALGVEEAEARRLSGARPQNTEALRIEPPPATTAVVPSVAPAPREQDLAHRPGASLSGGEEKKTPAAERGTGGQQAQQPAQNAHPSAAAPQAARGAQARYSQVASCRRFWMMGGDYCRGPADKCLLSHEWLSDELRLDSGFNAQWEFGILPLWTTIVLLFIRLRVPQRELLRLLTKVTTSDEERAKEAEAKEAKAKMKRDASDAPTSSTVIGTGQAQTDSQLSPQDVRVELLAGMRKVLTMLYDSEVEKGVDSAQMQPHRQKLADGHGPTMQV